MNAMDLFNNWRQAETWITIFAGAVEVNALAQEERVSSVAVDRTPEEADTLDTLPLS